MSLGSVFSCGIARRLASSVSSRTLRAAVRRNELALSKIEKREEKVAVAINGLIEAIAVKHAVGAKAVSQGEGRIPRHTVRRAAERLHNRSPPDSGGVKKRWGELSKREQRLVEKQVRTALVAKRKARLDKQRAVQERRAKAVARLKAKLTTLGRKKKALVKERRAVTRQLRSSRKKLEKWLQAAKRRDEQNVGATAPFLVFLAERLREKVGMKEAAESWKRLSEDERQVYVEQARKNREARLAQSALTPYQQFWKERYPEVLRDIRTKEPNVSHAEHRKAAACVVGKMWRDAQSTLG
eukprot:Sspe_Gene.108210::Locus_87377_Transcript_1_1_Confidence_1.000_Length_975::g.108210::m.108210